jgi:hypothetical protein
MSEVQNNPVIFNRLKYNSERTMVKGCLGLQKGIAGNGNKITNEQLSAFHNELRFRKFSSLVVFLSIPAGVFFYKRNPSLALVSGLFSHYLSNSVYSSRLLASSSASITKDMVSESEDNYRRKILRANHKILQRGSEINKSVKFYTRREYNELFKYR